MAEVVRPIFGFSQRAEIYLNRSLQVVCDQFPIRNVFHIDKHGTFRKPRLEPELLFLFENIFFQLLLDFGLRSRLVSNCHFVLEQEQHPVQLDLLQSFERFLLLLIPFEGYTFSCQLSKWF